MRSGDPWIPLSSVPCSKRGLPLFILRMQLRWYCLGDKDALWLPSPCRSTVEHLEGEDTMLELHIFVVFNRLTHQMRTLIIHSVQGNDSEQQTTHLWLQVDLIVA